MVLISHRYKFIYIKNKKVAGSSIESFFGQFCIDPNEKYSFDDKINEKISNYGIIGSRCSKKKGLWYNHKTAKEIKNDIPNNIWNSYLKFCVVRNPWDVMVSRYYWDNRGGKNIHTNFNKYIKNFNNNQQNNWNIYTINNKPICDYYIRYDNLKEDIIKLCNILGIKNYNINHLPNHKNNIRIEKKHYSYYYNDFTKNIVYKNNKNEIDFHKFNFENINSNTIEGFNCNTNNNNKNNKNKNIKNNIKKIGNFFLQALVIILIILIILFLIKILIKH